VKVEEHKEDKGKYPEVALRIENRIIPFSAGGISDFSVVS
jgi:hypothetical protein